MNRLEQLTNEKFNGDLDSTFEYMFTQLSPEEQDYYAEDLTSEQIIAFRQHLLKRAEEKGIDIQEIANDSFSLAEMDLTKEEVKNMESNPFKAALAKDILKFVILNAGLAAFYLVTSAFDKDTADELLPYALSVTGLVTTYFSYGMVKDILNIYRFKKLKKYDKEAENERNIGIMK